MLIMLICRYVCKMKHLKLQNRHNSRFFIIWNLSLGRIFGTIDQESTMADAASTSTTGSSQALQEGLQPQVARDIVIELPEHPGTL